MKNFKRLKRIYRLLRCYRVSQKKASVTLHNYIGNPVLQDFWLRDYIEARGLLANSKKKISIFSVFGTPEILNPDAIVYIDMPGDNIEALKKIQELNKDETRYMAFATQPRLKPDAADYIWAYVQELEKRLRILIEA